MKEKNFKKISLSTILLIIAIIVIIVMGLFIYKLNKDKSNEIQKSTELQAQVNSLSNTVSDLNGKLSNMSGTINSNANSENNKEKTLSEDEALTILKSEFDIIEKIYSSPNTFFNVSSGDEIKDFEKTILKYGTENLLKEIKNNLPMCILLKDGKYYFYEGGGAREYNGLDKFENINITNSTISSNLKTKQMGPNPNNPNDAGAWIEKDSKSCECVLVKKDNQWLIDKLDTSVFN